MKPITLEDLNLVVEVLDGVRNIRGLALQLGLLHDDRDRLDSIVDPKDRKVELVTLWVKKMVNCSWQCLREALCAPQLDCIRAAEKIEVFLQSGNWSNLVKQESGDSAVSVSFSPTSTVSSASPSFNFSTKLPTGTFTKVLIIHSLCPK